MNVKKTVKKMAAVVAGLSTVGLSMSAAASMDLSDYPEPFVVDGVFNGRVVVGEVASTADTIAAGDIMAQMQADAVTPVDSVGGQVVVTGGDTFEVDLNEAFPSGSNTVYTSTDLEGFQDRTIRWNRQDIDVREELVLVDGKHKVQTSLEGDEDFERDPYYTVQDGAIMYKYVFETGFNLSEVTPDTPLRIKFLGSDLEITSIQNGQMTIESATTRFLTRGESYTIDGRTVTLNNVGESSVLVSVDGQQEVLTETGGPKEFAGEFEVEVSAIFFESGGSDNGAQLKFGSEVSTTVKDGESLETYGEPDRATDAEWLWEISITTDTPNGYIAAYNSIPRDRLDVSSSFERPALAAGEYLSLPNNYASAGFSGLSNSVYSQVSLNFPTIKFNATEDSRRVAMFTSGDNKNVFYLGASGTTRGEQVAVSNNPGNASEYQVWYLDKGDWKMHSESDNGVFRIRPGRSDAELTVTPAAASAAAWNFSMNGEDLMLNVTKDGAVYRFIGDDGDSAPGDLMVGSTNLGTKEKGVRLTNGINFNAPKGQLESDRFSFWLPHDVPEVNFVVKSGATTTTSTGSSSGAYIVNPIPVGVMVSDAEAMPLLGSSTPLLVVGGPNANTVAAELLGNPSQEEVSEMFESGLAKIKLFSDRNALLVAGYSAQDTTRAARVLASYRDYTLTGEEVELVVSDVSNIEVRTTPTLPSGN